MKVLILSHYFVPEIGAPQARLSDLARMWTEQGAAVHVLTGMPNHPTGIKPPPYRRKIRVRESQDGYSITRTWLYATPNEGFIKKTIGHLSFMVSSVLLGFRPVGKPDVIVVSSPTFFSIGSAWLIARLKRARLVVEVRDLWPAIFVDLGVLTNKQIIRMLERLELAAYRSADAVVVVSDGFKGHIESRGIPSEKIHTIRNGVDLEAFPPKSEQSPIIRERLGARPVDTLVLYIGAHGISQGISSVVEAAALLKDQPVHFALVGEGADKKNVLTEIERLKPGNVTSLPGVPRDEVAGLIASADICLVPLRDVPLFSTFIPSKIFEILAAERPIVGAVRGESASILRSAGQSVVEPGNPVSLAAAVQHLAESPSTRRRLAQQGREYVAANFDRRKLAGDYLNVLREVLK